MVSFIFYCFKICFPFQEANYPSGIFFELSCVFLNLLKKERACESFAQEF